MATLDVLYALGFGLVILGIAVVAAAVIISSRRSRGKEKTETHAAGVIMIGPIPIIFGTDKKAVKEVLFLAVALTVIMLVIYYLLWR